MSERRFEIRLLRPGARAARCALIVDHVNPEAPPGLHIYIYIYIYIHIVNGSIYIYIYIY